MTFMDFLIPSTPFSVTVVPTKWDAHWIAPTDSLANRTGVYRFRTTFDLRDVSEQCVIRVSADNRYRFYVNGVEAGVGPGRGDLHHWRYETYDVTQLLRKGENVLAAIVWFADIPLAAIAQIGDEPGFLASTDVPAYKSLVDTPGAWKCTRLVGHEFFENDAVPAYCIVGPCERISASATDQSWLLPSFDESQWTVPIVRGTGDPYGSRDSGERRWLVGNTLPQPCREPGRIEKIIRTYGLTTAPAELIPTSPIVVPRGTTATIILDNGVLCTAYPKLRVSGGAGSTIRQRYSEALCSNARLEEKGNRNETEAKTATGYFDDFLPAGRVTVFEPLWYRTFRFVEITVNTAADDLTIHALDYDFTGYPFCENAEFSSSDGSLKAIWDVGWRTARLCAFESYMDCPYYEQLQYGGDTRLQCLISYYVSGDTRLGRNAISQLHDSLLPSGLTQSRYPSSLNQVIPPFSLWWITMIHDYWMFADDTSFVQSMLPAGRNVLAWFISRLRRDRLLGPISFWAFVDWTHEYVDGVPPGATAGGSSALTFQLVLALRDQADLEETLGLVTEAERYRSLADDLVAGILLACWDEHRGLVAETPEKAQFGQHTNSLAILAKAFDAETTLSVAEHILRDASDLMIQTGFYFRFYQHRALREAGLGDSYLEWLGDWHDMIDLGLTTFAEKVDPVRSDCHAWSAHPLVGFFDTVLGVVPTKPGFKEVSITPRLGKLNWAECSIPHPNGKITVRAERVNGDVRVRYDVPPGVTVCS
jgi:alpha-L-rhamnosidase